MAVRRDHPKARDAETFYEVEQRLQHITLLKLTPKTGRTHQIRVHLTHLGYPILADRLYGGKYPVTKTFLRTGRDAETKDQVILERQALHAARLEITHPITGKPLVFEAKLPNDMQQALELLRSDSSPDG